MSTDPIRRARMLGASLVALAFVAGGVAGMAFARRETSSLRVTVTATDQMPRELDRLGLSPDQSARIQPILTASRDRVLGVMRQFEPGLRAVLDSTDAEIRVVLTPSQRAQFDSVRRANPPFRTQLRPRR